MNPSMLPNPNPRPLDPQDVGLAFPLVGPVKVGKRLVYQRAECPVGCTACGPQIVPSSTAVYICLQERDDLSE